MDEDLDHYAKQIGDLVGRLDSLIELQQARNSIVVTHTQAGMGVWGAVAVTACLFTTLMVISLAIVILPDIHDLKAWENVFGRDIAAMKQQINQQKP